MELVMAFWIFGLGLIMLVLATEAVVEATKLQKKSEDNLHESFRLLNKSDKHLKESWEILMRAGEK